RQVVDRGRGRREDRVRRADAGGEQLFELLGDPVLQAGEPVGVLTGLGRLAPLEPQAEFGLDQSESKGRAAGLGGTFKVVFDLPRPTGGPVGDETITGVVRLARTARVRDGRFGLDSAHALAPVGSRLAVAYSTPPPGPIQFRDHLALRRGRAAGYAR